MTNVQMTNDETKPRMYIRGFLHLFRHSNIRHSSLIRHSNFVIRHCPRYVIRHCPFSWCPFGAGSFRR